MHEDILPSPVRSDETVAFRGVVELYGPGLLNKWSPGTVRRRRSGRARRAGSCVAVLLSMLSTSVTCMPFCPGPARTSRVAPGSTAPCPARSSTAACRKASPDPSASSTNPKPFSGFNQLTEGADGRTRRLLATRLAGAERARRLVAGRRRGLIMPRLNRAASAMAPD